MSALRSTFLIMSIRNNIDGKNLTSLKINNNLFLYKQYAVNDMLHQP